MSEKIGKETYLRHLERSKNTLNYFTFFRPYTRIMSKLEALFIQDVANTSSLPGIVKQRFGGEEYFKCTTRFLEDSTIGWSVMEQRRLLRTLTDRGYLKLKKKGLPAVRWIRIDYEKLENDLDALPDQKRHNQSGPKGRNQLGSKQPDYTGSKQPVKKEDTNVSSPKKERTNSRPASGNGKEHVSNGFFSANGEDETRRFCRDQAVKIYRLGKANLPYLKESFLPKWTEAAAKGVEWLRRERKMKRRHAESYFAELLDDHIYHATERSQPRVYSMTEFVKRFAAIEDARRRRAMPINGKEEVLGF